MRAGSLGVPVLALVVALGARPAAAEEPRGTIPGYALDTTVSAGYRLVDIDGSRAKYREDYNLRSGGRLFRFSTAGAATAPDTTRLDRFRLEIDTPGDEPVSHFRLRAADRSLYELRADFTRSKYEYAVPQLFEREVAGNVRTDDLHDHDLVRTNGAVDLVVRPPNLPLLRLGYRLYRRDGDAVSSVLVPAGDTFLVRAPVDADTHVGRLGTEFRTLGTDVFLQQEYRRVDRRRSLDRLGGAGLDPTDASTLQAFRSDQEESLDIPTSTVRLRRAFGDTFELTGSYLLSRAELEFDRLRRRDATTTAGGAVAEASSAGGGDATLSAHVLDLGGSARLHERVRLHTSYRFDERAVDGAFDEASGFGVLAARTGDHVRLHSVSSEVEVTPRDDLSLRAGARYGRRDARFSLADQRVATDLVGALGSARWRPWSFLDLFARYESARIDDPFTVAGDPTASPALPEREVALTFTNRGTAGVRVTPRDWVELSYRLVADSRENDRFAARTRSVGNSLALTLVPVRGLTLFASYTRRDLDSRADVLLAPLYLRASSVQEGTEDVFVTELRHDFALLGERWSTGWDVVYVNAGNALRPRLEPDRRAQAFFDLDRVDGGAFLTLHHRVVEPSVEFRLIDYNEPVLPRNDYRATMIVVKLTRRFDL